MRQDGESSLVRIDDIGQRQSDTYFEKCACELASRDSQRRNAFRGSEYTVFVGTVVMYLQEQCALCRGQSVWASRGASIRRQTLRHTIETIDVAVYQTSICVD